MIKKVQSKNAFKAGEFQAASMSDIAFLLLVFFIVTTIFALEEGIPLILPARSSEVAKVKQKNIMEIRAYPDGSVVTDGENVGVAGIRSLVERRLSENDKLVVVIATHPDAEYGLMVDLLDEIKLANCRKISLKTLGGAQ
ncbi:MAG: biopolymer transporter ExbD [Candidatus Krumholzibacteria bacterium]|nr:biopolymer transporter ExbD [Candidatus Krumholzibacteria bacterium]MDH4336089.1 biopolymer transporter ExbD [Candidatus Krumholzibacteria bacterium]MDH5268335.1 biopolymer transporter ExbD [Candidatus Krumholzibacteria bacterium]MDH5628151.1 biopolymer transporter ExbD [Candidatus Krumholzibacteria bacterium]